MADAGPAGASTMPALLNAPPAFAGIASLGVVLAAVYMLFVFQKVMFGPLDNPKNKKLPDLSTRELTYLLPMVVMAFWLGIYPATFLSDIDPAVGQTLSQFKAKWGESRQDIPTARRMGEGDRPADPDAADQAGKPAAPRTPTE